jgi:Holliday junction resolvase RusA-like endonuclease
MVPPGSNHYKTYKIIIPRDPRQKAFVQWYLTDEANAFYGCVQMVAGGRSLIADSLEVSYIIFLPKGGRGDVDNYAKCVLDSLKHARVIRDDYDVDDIHGHRRRDALNPRTVIVIKSNQGELEL